MKSLAAFAALALGVSLSASPAFARDTFIVDNAHLFSADTISTINAKVADFYATAHKEVFVETEPTVDGTPQAAAESTFAKQQVNGVLIYIVKSPKAIGVVPDKAARQFFPPQSTAAIRTAIKNAFNSGDFNGGITNGVDLTLSEYRSHLGALSHKAAYAPVGSGETRSSQAGFNMSFIWILIVLAVIFFVIRGIFRAMAGPRVTPPGYGGGPMMGGGYGPGYGPGYGGGYGGGGGGSFWSGLMGGLGGAFLGNELFGRRDEFGGNEAGFVDQGGNQNSGVDSSGFQSDPGQADMGNASFGGWGDSGGGGGSDWGGGGGGDFGGGGGDNSGGGW